MLHKYLINKPIKFKTKIIASLYLIIGDHCLTLIIRLLKSTLINLLL